jgi:hypothetical protein
MSKLSAYQKLKRQNAELRRQLHQVCIYPESNESFIIITTVRMENNIVEAVWAGDHSNDECRFTGLLKQIHDSSSA